MKKEKERNKFVPGDLFYFEGLPETSPSGALWSDWIKESNGDKERLFLVIKNNLPGYSGVDSGIECLDIKRDHMVYLTIDYCNWAKKLC